MVDHPDALVFWQHPRTPWPGETLLHEYRRRNAWYQAQPPADGPEFDTICNWIDAPLDAGLSMKPETLAEFAALTLLVLLDGDQTDDSTHQAELVATANAALMLPSG